MITVVDLTEKRHIFADSYKDAWKQLNKTWWYGSDAVEYEREFTFKKKFGVDMSDFYNVLADSKLENVADTIEREVSDMILELELMTEDEYKEIMLGFGDTYVIENNNL